MTTSQRRGLTVAIIAALLLGLIFYLRQNRTPPSPEPTSRAQAPDEFQFDSSVRPQRVSPVIGELRPYRIDMSNRTIVDTGAAVGMEGASEQTIDVALSGIWLLQTLPSEGDDALVHAQFLPRTFSLTNAETAVPSSDLEPAKKALSSSLVIRYSADGRVLGIRVPPQLDTDPDTFVMLKMLIASMQIVYGEGAKDEWEVIEEDVSGALRARYRWEKNGDLRKTKLAYENQPVGDAPVIGDGIELTSSLDSKFRMMNSGWIGSLSFNEQQSLKIAGIMGAQTDQDLSMFTTSELDARLLGKSPQEIATLPDSWTRWPERPLADPGLAGRRRLELDPKFHLALTMNVPDVLNRFGKLGRGADDAAERVELEQLLAMLFQGRPSEVEVAVAKILAGDVSDDEARILINGLADAGNPEAQAGLVELVNAGGLDTAAREASVHAFHSLTRPTADSLAALRKSMDEFGEPLGSASLLALGRAAGNMERDGTNEDPSAAASAVRDLIARFRSATDPHQKSLALDALGNSGHSLALPIMVEVITGPPGVLRLAAIKGLRFMPSGQADDLLQVLVQKEDDEEGRRSALFAIGFRDQGLYAPLMVQRLRVETSAGAAMDVLKLLAPRVKIAQVRAVISWASTESPHETIRTTASELLASDN